MAMAGSSRMARRAGTHAAPSAISTTMHDPNTKVGGSGSAHAVKLAPQHFRGKQGRQDSRCQPDRNLAQVFADDQSPTRITM
jgi:hypothetical protein